MSAPARLRAAIAHDLKPTTPLPAPSVRALTLAPLAVAIVLAVPLLHFVRPDADAIGIVRAWGFSIAQGVCRADHRLGRAARIGAGPRVVALAWPHWLSPASPCRFSSTD